MAGIDEIKRLKGLCEEYNLEGREILDKYTDEELAALFNGIGPEAFPSWLRTALDALRVVEAAPLPRHVGLREVRPHLPAVRVGRVPRALRGEAERR